MSAFPIVLPREADVSFSWQGLAPTLSHIVLDRGRLAALLWATWVLGIVMALG